MEIFIEYQTMKKTEETVEFAGIVAFLREKYTPNLPSKLLLFLTENF